MGRKADLESRIRRVYGLLSDYEEKKAFSDRPEEVHRFEYQIASYRKILAEYTRIYWAVCEKLHLLPEHDILEIAADIVPELIEHRIEPIIQASLHTKLPGSRIIQINIYQIFRIADLLTQPESVKAKAFYEAITNTDKMRRALSRKKTFKIGSLGHLRPVAKIEEKYDEFWKPAIPNFRLTKNPSVYFIPFEMTLTDHLKNLKCLPDSILEVVENFDSQIFQNIQISGRLRIYPPGIGVVHLGITLEFQNAVYVEMVAQIARNVEDLLFIDAEGLEKPCVTVLLEIVDQVADYLFKDKGYDFTERRWLPPITVYRIHDTDGLQPNDLVNEFAHLLALAPGNNEDLSYLRNRIENSLNSPQWLKDQVLAVAGQGTALFLVSQAYAKGKRAKRHKLIKWLSDTHELVSAAEYAQQAFAEAIEQIALPRLLDDSWLPQSVKSTTGFDYLYSLITTMRQVMQAIASIRIHLQSYGAGTLMVFAKDLWTYNYPIDLTKINNNLDYIANWLGQADEKVADQRILELKTLLEEIKAMSPLFPDHTDGYVRKLSDSSIQEELENQLLDQLWEIGEAISGEGSSYGLITNKWKDINRLRKQLGL